MPKLNRFMNITLQRGKLGNVFIPETYSFDGFALLLPLDRKLANDIY
jgi:hypothetical protein